MTISPRFQASGRKPYNFPFHAALRAGREEDLSEEQKKYTPLNAELAKIWPVITDAKPGPADADQWKDVKDKLKLLER